MSQSDKVFTVTITVSGGGVGTTSVGTGMVTTTIEDDDPLTAAISIGNAGLDENSDSSATFRISLSGAEGVSLGEDTTITWEISTTSTATGGAATEMARDYTTPAAFTTNIAMSSSMADFSIALNNDNLNEGAETIVVRLLSASSANVSITNVATDAAATATIAANDGTTLSVAGPNAAVQEGSDAVFTLTLGGGTPSADIVAAYTLGGAPASDLVGGSLSGEKRITLAEVASGEPITIAIGIADDALLESAETLIVALDDGADRRPTGGGGGGVLIAPGGGQARAVIAGSDGIRAEVTAAQQQVEEGGEALFRISLAGEAHLAPLFVDYRVSGTARAGVDRHGVGVGHAAHCHGRDGRRAALCHYR